MSGAAPGHADASRGAARRVGTREPVGSRRRVDTGEREEVTAVADAGAGTRTGRPTVGRGVSAGNGRLVNIAPPWVS